MRTWFSMLVFLYLAGPTSAREAVIYEEPIRVSLNLVCVNESPGCRKVVNRDRRTFYIDPKALIDLEDIAMAKHFPQRRVVFNLTYGGQFKLKEAKRFLHGQRLAILINDEPYAAPNILGAMASSSVEFTAFSAEEAGEIVREINDLKQFK